MTDREVFARPLVHGPYCAITIAAPRGELPARWEDVDEDYCTCDLKDRIKDARAVDDKTINLFEAGESDV